MIDRFTLAAQVLLARRLNSLIRINEAVEIDTSYITCAEYQLFIDAQKAEGKYVQPDHWSTNQFPTGTAKQPISGVGRSNVAAFCEWLTNQEFTPGFQYRLPTVTEFRGHFVNTQALGCWCKSKQNINFEGFSVQQHLDWFTEINEQIAQGELFVLNYALELALELSISRTINQIRAADKRSNPNLFKFRRYLSSALAAFVKHAYVRASTLSHSCARDLIHQLDSAKKYAHGTMYTHDLNLHLDCASSTVYELAFNILEGFNLDFDINSIRNFKFDIRLLDGFFSARTIIPFLEINIDTNFDAEIVITKADELSFSLNVDCTDDSRFTFAHANNYSTDFINRYIQICLVCLVANFNRFFSRLKHLSEKASRIRGIDARKQYLGIESEYTTLRDQIAQLYASLIILKLRRQGKISAWEGICIVRERLD